MPLAVACRLRSLARLSPPAVSNMRSCSGLKHAALEAAACRFGGGWLTSVDNARQPAGALLCCGHTQRRVFDRATQSPQVGQAVAAGRQMHVLLQQERTALAAAAACAASLGCAAPEACTMHTFTMHANQKGQSTAQRAE
jgi:hypothetical protein